MYTKASRVQGFASGGVVLYGADLAGWEARCQPGCAGLESLELVVEQECPQEIPGQAR